MWKLTLRNMKWLAQVTWLTCGSNLNSDELDSVQTADCQVTESESGAVLLRRASQSPDSEFTAARSIRRELPPSHPCWPLCVHTHAHMCRGSGVAKGSDLEEKGESPCPVLPSTVLPSCPWNHPKRMPASWRSSSARAQPVEQTLLHRNHLPGIVGNYG